MSLNNTCVAFASEGGLVPALGLVKRLLARAPNDRVLLFCAVQGGDHAESLEDLLALKDQHLDRLSLGFVTQRDADEAELLSGRLDAAKVGSLAGKLFDAAAVREYFVCGPQTLLDDVTGALKSIGIEPGRIHTDDSALERAAGSANGLKPPAGLNPQVNETRVDFVMDGRRRSFNMLRGSESILDAAARAGIELPYSCKAGVCSTCRTKLVRGEVALAQNYALEDWELEQGFILACQAHAKTSEIELTYDEK